MSFGFVDLLEPRARNYPHKRGISMETYRIHENGAQLGNEAIGSGVVSRQPATEQPAFDGRLNRLASLVGAFYEQSKRLDASVSRLSGLSPPGNSGRDDKADEPSNVLSKLDLIIDQLEFISGNNHGHLTRLESL